MHILKSPQSVDEQQQYTSRLALSRFPLSTLVLCFSWLVAGTISKKPSGQKISLFNKLQSSRQRWKESGKVFLFIMNLKSFGLSWWDDEKCSTLKHRQKSSQKIFRAKKRRKKYVKIFTFWYSALYKAVVWCTERFQNWRNMFIEEIENGFWSLSDVTIFSLLYPLWQHCQWAHSVSFEIS
jgi:hypothetical protein